MHKDLPPVIFLMGPTATGKTQLAIELTQHYPCEIISVDSAMVYRGMNIGTGKPNPDILAKIPHHLVDILEPDSAYSAAKFRTDALEIIEKIINAKRIPLLVGGTMLYFHALQFGITPLPSANAKVREQLAAQAEEQGLERLHQQLSEIDPQAAARINVNDPQRILRALEVYQLTGMSISQHIADHGKSALPYKSIAIGLLPNDRDILHQRIALRFNQMLEQGFIEEVHTLKLQSNLNIDLPSMRSVGYRQIWQYLDGEYDLNTMQDKAIAATRQLAKRQLTWLRRWPNLVTITSEAPHLLQLRNIMDNALIKSNYSHPI